jgi:hypothetical protein
VDANIASVSIRTREVLLDSLKRGTGATSCLICISGIKKSDPIWNCESCYCTFHLNCIQRWARDNIFQQKNEIENFDCKFGQGSLTEREASVQLTSLYLLV